MVCCDEQPTALELQPLRWSCGDPGPVLHLYLLSDIRGLTPSVPVAVSEVRQSAQWDN